MNSRNDSGIRVGDVVTLNRDGWANVSKWGSQRHNLWFTYKYVNIVSIDVMNGQVEFGDKNKTIIPFSWLYLKKVNGLMIMKKKVADLRKYGIL